MSHQSPVPFAPLRSGVIFALCVSPLLGASLSAQTSQAMLKLTLDDAVRIALQQNLDLDSEAMSTQIARFSAYGSWGAFDPMVRIDATASEAESQGQSQLAGGTVVKRDSLGFNGSLELPLRTGGALSLTLDHANDKTNNSFALFDVATSESITLSLSQPLLKGAWSRYATTTQREEEVRYEVQIEHEREVRHLMMRDVIRGYWDLVSAREQLSVRELAVERAQTQLKQSQRRLELGAGTEVDVLQAETTLAQQEELRLNARFVLRQAEDTLRRMIFQRTGGEIETFLDDWDLPIEPLTPLPSVSDRTLNWRESLRTAIENRPEIAQRRLDIDVAEVRLQNARSNRLPQLDLNLSSSSGGYDTDPSEAFDTALGWDFPTNSASLNFSMPILNRSAKYGERSARVAVRQARIAFDRQQLDVLAEVRAAVRDLEYRAEALLAAIKSAALATRQLEAEQVRLDIGLSTTFQVLQFQETLAEARSTEVDARAAYAKAVVALDHAEGTLDASAKADDAGE